MPSFDTLISRLRGMLSSPAPEEPVELDPVFMIPDGVRIYAIGDIHGRSELLAKLLREIERDIAQHPAQRVIEIFLGDYIDRGFNSREVIDLLLAPHLGRERICLMGNHEETLLKFLEEPKILRDWGSFGGYATLASYGLGIPDSMTPEKLAEWRDRFQANLPETHLAFLKGLQLTYSIGDYLFVHAGIHPKLPMEEQTREHLLWIRDPFLKHEGFFSQYIVHGHSPVPVPEVHPHRANLDITTAEINSLCCLVIEGTEKHRIILVNDKKD